MSTFPRISHPNNGGRRAPNFQEITRGVLVSGVENVLVWCQFLLRSIGVVAVGETPTPGKEI